MGRRRQVHVAESDVMGAAAVAVTAGWLAVAGLVQIAGFPGSRAIAAAGGRAFDITWALCFILAFALVIVGRILATRAALIPYAKVLYLGGSALMLLGIVTYGYVTLSMPRAAPVPTPPDWPRWTDVLEGRIVLFAFIGASVTNTAGFMLLITRQLRWVAERRQ